MALGIRGHSTEGLSLILILIFFCSFIIFLNPVYGERIIEFQKIVDLDKQSLKNILSEPENLPLIFPDNVKSVKVLDQADDIDTIRIFLNFNGFSFPTTLQFQNSEIVQIARVTEGDLRGTKMVTTLTETWGYDGTPNMGTKVDMKILLKTSGIFWVFGFIPDDTITFSLNKALMDIVTYSMVSDESSKTDKDLQNSEEQNSDVNKNSQRQKKRK